MQIVALFFFFNDTATTEIYTLSLHTLFRSQWRSARDRQAALSRREGRHREWRHRGRGRPGARHRSEEHTSELQSRQYLVCRLLLAKKKQLHPQQPPGSA